MVVIAALAGGQPGAGMPRLHCCSRCRCACAVLALTGRAEAFDRIACV